MTALTAIEVTITTRPIASGTDGLWLGEDSGSFYHLHKHVHPPIG